MQTIVSKEILLLIALIAFIVTLIAFSVWDLLDAEYHRQKDRKRSEYDSLKSKQRRAAQRLEIEKERWEFEEIHLLRRM